MIDRFCFLYIIAISLQLSGSLLLLINFGSTKRENLIKEFAKGRLLQMDNNTNKPLYNPESFVDVWQTAFLNKFAFGYIFVGYLTGIFGDIGMNDKVVVAISVSFLFAIETALPHSITRRIRKCCKKLYKPITNDELERLHIEPEVENISNSTIDEILNADIRGDNNA